MTINELKAYVDTEDNGLRIEFQRMYEDFTHEVTHILNEYEDYLSGKIGTIHDEVWDGVDSILSTSSTAPVQNKVITNALNNKANSNHNHDNRYYTEAEVNNLLSSKVNVEQGKVLSTNDYTNADKATVAQALNLINNYTSAVTGVKGDAEVSYRTGNINITPANIGLNNVNNTSDADKPISTATLTALNGKVDKVAGKVLSTNDFTDAYKSQIDNLENNYRVEIDNVLNNNSNNPVRNSTISAALNLKAPLNSPNFTGIPKVPNITSNSPGDQIVNKNYIDQIQNNQIDDVYYLNTSTSYNDLNNIITTGNILPIFKTTVLVNNQQTVLNLQYIETVNAKHYFAGYVPSAGQYYVYAIDSNSTSNQWVSTVSFNNVALTGTPTAPTAATGTNTTQIATTAFIQQELENYSGVFKAGYLTTPQDLYNAFTNNLYIYFYASNKVYICTDIVITGQNLTSIDFVNINGTTISKIIGRYDTNNNFNYSPVSYTIPDMNNITFSDYPVISNTVVNLPDSAKQFVTKEYIDTIVYAIDEELDENSSNPVQNQAIVTALNQKIDIDPDRGLSSNDFTDEEKEKLYNIDLSLYASIDDAIPLNGIVMWYGASNEIPNGWQLCDGTNGTPNLSSRFTLNDPNSILYIMRG